MDSGWSLSVIAAFAGFFLQTTLAFGVCAALCRLTESATRRFVVWSAYIYGTAAYWLYLAIVLWAPQQPSAKVIQVALGPVTSSFATWQIPSSWAFPLALLLRVTGSLYLLTLCFFTFRHIGRRRHLRWILSFTYEPPAEMAETFRSLARDLRVSRSRLLLLSGATSPATFGSLRPVILLPNSCVEEDRLELEDILRHELHHVQRCDAIWNELAIMARGLLFFHPAIWYAVGKMRFDRELACDFAVVARSPDRKAAYAECLIRFAQSNVVPEHSGWGIDFAASTHQLTARVRSILAVSKMSSGWMRCLRVASGVAIASLFAAVAPSLAILLSFARPPVSHNAYITVVQTPSRTLANASRSARKNHASASSAMGHEALSSENLQSQEENGPAMDLQPDTHPGSISSPINSGSQLRRRGEQSTAGNSGRASQTVALTDAGAEAQSTRTGDSKQAIQQTATAALGIYKKLSAIDRH